MWINHTYRFTKLESYEGKSLAGEGDLGFIITHSSEREDGKAHILSCAYVSPSGAAYVHTTHI